jgi:6-phosphogluconolactonase
MFAYVGCRTTKERKASGKGISVYRVESDGKWNLIQLVPHLVNPSFQCFDETGEYLYSIHGDFSEISAFKINRKNGHLTYLNTANTGGTNPVHLTVDRNNKWIYVANLATGMVSVIPRHEDGTVGDYMNRYAIPGKEEGHISHPHQVLQDPSREYLIVSCQGRKYGYGQVDVLKINHDGTLTRTDIVRSREIAEPRHIAFTGPDTCYGVNEKDYTVTAYHFDAVKGKMKPFQIVPTLPDTFTDDGWASGIVAGKDGRCVYVSNRKADSVSVFAVDPQSGKLSLRQWMPAGGKQPRFITTTPDGKKLVVANELSASIRVYNIDEETGKLTQCIETVGTPNPVCVTFAE